MQVVMVMFKADGERRSFSLPRAITVIGRREDCDLRIPLADVSRKHCRLINENETLRVEDLGSSNGTFHNGVRIQEAVVQAGDTITVGPVTFVAQIDGVPADDQIQPAMPASADDDTSVGMAVPSGIDDEAVAAGSGGVDDAVDLSALDAMEEDDAPPIDLGELGIEEDEESGKK
jgi:predicted component of type VI protein secretion system